MNKLKILLLTIGTALLVFTFAIMVVVDANSPCRNILDVIENEESRIRLETLAKKLHSNEIEMQFSTDYGSLIVNQPNSELKAFIKDYFEVPSQVSVDLLNSSYPYNSEVLKEPKALKVGYSRYFVVYKLDSSVDFQTPKILNLKVTFQNDFFQVYCEL